MSSFTHPAAMLGERVWSRPSVVVGGHGFARRACQAMVLLPLFSLVLLPEYVQGLGDPGSKSILYRASVGPLRVLDLLLLAVIAAHGVAWASSRRLRVHMPRTLMAPGVGFMASIALAMIYGLLHGGVNLFFDWRALALGVGTYVVFALWVQTAEQARWALVLFAAYMGLRIVLMYAQFLRGGGDVIVGVRVPVFDGPTLSAIVFTAVLALWMVDASNVWWHKLLLIGLSAGAYLMVLLCFRRTFWAELGVATVLLLILRKRGRGQKLLLALGALVAVAAMLGPTFRERVRSMNFAAGETEFSQDNPDHVGEVLDAWDQVQRNPVVGIGLGRSFQTLRIQDWKEESVMVHNGPLHVWLKYGLMGLVCYVWFHVALFRWLYQRLRAPSGVHPAAYFRGLKSVRKIEGSAAFGTAEAVPLQNLTPEAAGAGAALTYLAAQFAVTLGFTPWPYSSMQSTTLIAFVLAIAMTGTTSCECQAFR